MDYEAPPIELAAPQEHGTTRIAIPVFVPKVSRCPPHAPDEIVVCAQDSETFRLRPLPETHEEPLPRTTARLNERTSIGAEVERAGVGGEISNRVMLRGKIKF